MSAYDTLILSYPSLIDYWPLSELTGTTSLDMQGSHPLTTGGTNPPTLGQGGLPSGETAYLFNGQGGNAGSYAITTPAWNIGGTGITIEAWIYIATNPGEAEWIAGIYYSGFLVGNLATQSDRSCIWNNWDNGASGRQITGPVLSLGTWHHLVGVAAAAGLMQFYIDTVAQTGQTMSGTVWASNNAAASANGWNIGGGSTSTKDAKFKVAKVALYNALLTPTQITANYNAGLLAPVFGSGAALLLAM
jgi:hypothetical protein